MHENLRKCGQRIKTKSHETLELQFFPIFTKLKKFERRTHTHTHTHKNEPVNVDSKYLQAVNYQPKNLEVNPSSSCELYQSTYCFKFANVTK